MSEFCRWDHPARQETRKEDWEPEDKAGDNHDRNANGQKPIGKFLLEIVFPVAWFLVAEEEQISEHLAHIKHVFHGREDRRGQATSAHEKDSVGQMVEDFNREQNCSDVMDILD